MVENAITKVARIAAHAAQGVVYKDSAGKEQTILPSGNKNMIDISGLSIGGNNSGDTGGGDDSDHPDIGADYYAGSLADGEITERYLLYERNKFSAETPDTPKTVTLLKDVGSKFNMTGDGITILAHLQKTVMTAGAKGEVTDIDLNYDEKNIVKDGYFTTTSYYPFYIKATDLATTNELDIPIAGIGENLSGKNFLAPHLKIQFKGNNQILLTSVNGYDNDGDPAGATGANYGVIVDEIATFSAQTAVAQLPSSINLFTGLASDNIVLSGSDKFFENTMDGIEITLDDHLSGNGGTPDIDKLGISKTFKIDKKELISNNVFQIPYVHQPIADTSKNYTTVAVGTGARISPVYVNGKLSTLYLEGETSNNVKIGEGTLTINISRAMGYKNGGEWLNVTNQFTARVIKVTTYKD